jgi:hypothetical protein
VAGQTGRGVIEIRTGTNRRVILTKHYAIKVPRVRHPACGRRSNLWEREMWQHWRLIFPTWENLCPVLFADRFGVVLIMPRAQPADDSTIVDAAMEADGDCYPLPTVEFRAEEYGILGGRAVCFDYGLGDAKMVLERRAYYEGLTKD